MKRQLIVKSSIALLLGIGLLAGTTHSGLAATPDSYQQTSEAMAKDPATGVVFTQQYLSSHPEMSPRDRAHIVKELAATYNQNLRDPKAALAALDDGLAVFAKIPPTSSNDATPTKAAKATLLIEKATLLSKSSPEQAVALLDSNADLIITASNTTSGFIYATVLQYRKALPSDKQAEKIVPS